MVKIKTSLVGLQGYKKTNATPCKILLAGGCICLQEIAENEKENKRK